MVRTTKPGGRIVLVDPVWTDLNIINADNSSDKMPQAIINKKPNVKHPNAANLTAEWMKAAGAQNVETHDVQLKTSVYSRINLAVGLERKLDELVDENEISRIEADDYITGLKRRLENGAYMLFPYRFVVGEAPQL
jgi:hypothetical protein